MTEQGFLIGELLDDKYRIEKLLGQGGMGAVYRAAHLGTKRTVAVKVIHPQFSNNEEFVERFRREAEAAGRLRHPNVVDVTDFGFAAIRSGRAAYLVMEYLDGCTLADVLAEEGRLPLDWVVDILEQVCSAVDEAHCMGIIHRDLKPDNIWLEPNRRGGYTIKVLDFGLVRLGVSATLDIEGHQPAAIPPAAPSAPLSSADALRTNANQAITSPDSAVAEAATLMEPMASLGTLQPPRDDETSTPALSAPIGVVARAQRPPAGHSGDLEATSAAGLTRIGSVMGTPLYMSPEQCRGECLDRRSDIYSLGVIAYRMLTGETPFTGSYEELIRLHGTGVPRPVRERNSRIPHRMAQLIMGALAKDPVQRPQSAAGFASALRASIEGSNTLLRHGVSLYSERFPTFLRVSLLAYAPLIAVVGFMNLYDRVIPLQQLPHPFVTLVGPLLVFIMIAANLLSYATVAAVTVPIVVQSMIAPLRPIQIRTAFAALRRRWRAFCGTTIAVVAMILLGTALFAIPGVVAALYYALYAPVVIIERSGVRATLSRARSLAKRSWGTVLIITVLQFVLPVLVWIASVDASFTFKMNEDFSLKEVGFYFSVSGSSSLYQLLNVFVTPLTAIMTALLYLKTRHAGGESLRDAIEQFDALEIPRSKWQARMRSCSASQRSASHN